MEIINLKTSCARFFVASKKILPYNKEKEKVIGVCDVYVYADNGEVEF